MGRKQALGLLADVRDTFMLHRRADIYLIFKAWLVLRPDLIRLDAWELPFMRFIEEYVPEAEGYFYGLWLDSFTYPDE